MDEMAFSGVLSAAMITRAMMFEHVSYVKRELPGLKLSDALVAAHAPDAVIEARFERLLRWVREPIDGLHALIQALDEAQERGEADLSAWVLVAESAGSILRAYQLLAKRIGEILAGRPAGPTLSSRSRSSR